MDQHRRGGFLDTTVRLLTRRNSVYIAFILTGALVGERVKFFPLLFLSM
jgi:hypothetical protein